MDNLPIADPVIAPSPPPVVADRRGPDRVDCTRPALIDLVRQQPSGATVVKADAPQEASDSLAPARGILLGVLIAVPFWCLLAAGLWFWLRH
jgi:hypothetical protein